ncbi:bifunctional diguanylate cyclase/phosphodiesterase [Shewanella marisflavi]|uniref:D-glycero-D-manno-heptose 1-phosphate guanosyltransferase n=1 Tax=Shewanella marisflavi TaxID=260364 RepID=A0AAC9TXL7_9GAMM|nr:bifunctional diguanylate cyclase/phosphodiesterase [Shewanella marisflavi]ASJ95477.1 D-glycero-D-manno-heptose 1-phosphate guanosyltransferase [Shewanella marisflavi]
MTAIDLSSELDKIIENEKIHVLFQPIFNINSQRLHGFEALSRGPEHSALFSPVPLFQTAAHEGRLSELEEICRRHSIRQFDARELPGKLFINISPKALLEPSHAKGLTLSLVQELGLSPDQIVIELSEQYPADDIDLLKDCLNHYRSQGFLTAIDDLGTGYSGLRLWSELAPDYVKIDRHFIHQIDQSPVKQEFVRSIIDLCQSLSCKVIAEGIETPAELALLTQLGIVYCQGYLLGRPQTQPIQDLAKIAPLEIKQRQTRYAESAESLATRTISVTPEAKLKALSNRFTRSPHLQVVAIIDAQQQPLGVIDRAQLMELFSTPYGRALHENCPVVKVMNDKVLRVAACTPISEVSQRLTAEHGTVAPHFIVMRDQRLLGIGHTKDLLQQITEQRIKMARHANPLSGLPGNIPIQEELQRLRLQDRAFYLAYFDLCHFKPYNDIYGFCRGDEVIQSLALYLQQMLGDDHFVGHVGGDDFVVISTSDGFVEQCRNLLNRFNANKQQFYHQADWQRQQMMAEDRQGQLKAHPLISLCVGLLPPEVTRFCDEQGLSAYSAAAKKQAKATITGFSLFTPAPNDAAIAMYRPLKFA